MQYEKILFDSNTIQRQYSEDVYKTWPKQFGNEKSNPASSLGNLRLEFVLVFETSV